MFRLLITAMLVLFGLLGMGAEEGSCEIPEDNTPTPYRTVSEATATRTPLKDYRAPTPVRASTGLGVSASKVENLFKDSYGAFDSFGPDERSAMFFDGGGGAITLSLFGPQSDLESIAVNFSGINAPIIVSMTVGGLIETLAPGHEDRVTKWLDDNYPTGKRETIRSSAGNLALTLDTGSFGEGWIAEVLLEPQ